MRFVALVGAIDATALALAAVVTLSAGDFEAARAGRVLLLAAGTLTLFSLYPLLTSRPTGWESWELTTRLHGQDSRWASISYPQHRRHPFAAAFVAALPLLAAGIALGN